jgi:hypothetical protein
MMRHYSEHIIKLFALGNKSVEPQKKLFLEHIRECYHCRKTYNDMLKLLQGLDEIEANAEEFNEKDLRAIVQPEPEKHKNTLIYNTAMRPAGLRQMIRKPSFITAGILSVIVILVISFNFIDIFNTASSAVTALKISPSINFEKDSVNKKPIPYAIAYKNDKSPKDENKYYKDLLSDVEKQFHYRSIISDFAGIKTIIRSSGFVELMKENKNKKPGHQDTIDAIIHILKIEK